TPKKKDGSDVPPKDHGPDIAWSLRAGQGIVDVLPPTFPNDFNKDLLGLRQGEFSLCATVKGAQGCLNGTVTSGPRGPRWSPAGTQPDLPHQPGHPVFEQQVSLQGAYRRGCGRVLHPLVAGGAVCGDRHLQPGPASARAAACRDRPRCFRT